MKPSHILFAIEISERARHLEHAVEGPRREFELFGGVLHQRSTVCIGPRNLFEHSRRSRRIRADIRVPQGLEALALDLARPRHAFGDIRRAFLRWRQQEIGEINGGHFNREIKPVEQRAGETPDILGDTFLVGCALAGKTGFERLAATARVHRGHELEARGVGRAVIGTAYHDIAGFNRLAHGIERLRRKLRQFIEKKHAVMRQADFAGFGLNAPPVSAAMLAE